VQVRQPGEIWSGFENTASVLVAAKGREPGRAPKLTSHLESILGLGGLEFSEIRSGLTDGFAYVGRAGRRIGNQRGKRKRAR